MTEKNTPPSLANIEAEQALLGAVMANNACYRRVCPIVTADDFSDAAHAKIYSAITRIIQSGSLANAVTLKHLFENESGLDEVGGTRYLAALEGSVVSFLSAPDYANAIADLAMRRRALAVCDEYRSRIADTEQPATEAISGASSHLARAIGSGSGLVSAAAISEKLRDELEAPPRITPTGLPRLDLALEGGLWSGRLYGFAARQKKGKSAMLGTIALNAACAGQRVAFLCLEMTATELMRRFTARLLDVYPGALKDPLYRMRNAAKINQAWEKFKTMPLDLMDVPRMNLERMRLEIARIGMGKNHRGVVLDYLQLVSGKPKNISTAEFQDEAAQSLAELAKTYGIWIVTAAQLNREGEIRGSDGMLNACDAAFTLEGREVNGSDGSSAIESWLEMRATRYTAWKDIGSESSPAYDLNPCGPFFEERPASGCGQVAA